MVSDHLATDLGSIDNDDSHQRADASEAFQSPPQLPTWKVPPEEAATIVVPDKVLDQRGAAVPISELEAEAVSIEDKAAGVQSPVKSVVEDPPRRSHPGLERTRAFRRLRWGRLI
jgi:hypothetical protein